ncbi:MAG: MBOAT family protein [Prevotellaceae bacterium]|jgi:D-alanyl-lipoteichoic acid acyltransferase DltB (MBOAT superfamily)|nr:MBOAT family protein [Prevotellaceae bacterium]
MELRNLIERVFTYSEDSAIIFTQLSFWIFFAVLLIGYSFIYKKSSVAKSIYLVLFSFFFYYKSSGTYFFLLVFATFMDYHIARGIFCSVKEVKRKWLVALSVTVNLGILCYFKYAYFFTDVVNQLFNTSYEVVNIFSSAMNMLAGTEKFEANNLILPVGISFYTFQIISYTVDVYRRRVEPVRNILDFGFYVSFFPQLVAGPIVRAAEFIPQIYEKYSVTRREMWMSVFLILNGLVKKIVISDYISLNYVDRMFDDPLLYSGFELLMGTYGYALQIYCDFSGYTDIAIGVALLLGFRLPINFNSPYKAYNVQDFWRRWHISLSTWLRDYLYIPLGGNRNGRVRTYINLIITMLLGGLWHGASYKFIAWGAMHGIALAVNRFTKEHFSVFSRKFALPKALKVLITFHFVCLAWIFFRASSMAAALEIIGRICSEFYVRFIPEILLGYKTVFLLMAAAFTIHFLPLRFKSWYRHKFVELPVVLKLLIIVFAVIIMYQASSAELQPFIYFQF